MKIDSEVCAGDVDRPNKYHAGNVEGGVNIPAVLDASVDVVWLSAT